MGQIGLPDINVTFRQLAATAVNRSKKGIVAIIVKDDTNKTFTQKTYSNVTELLTDKALYIQSNYDALMDCFLGSPSKVIVIRIDIAGAITSAFAIAKGLSFDYLTTLSSIGADHQAVVVWTKAQNLTRNKIIKAVTYKAAVTDDMHIINFVNDTVKRKADVLDIAGYLYLGRLAGLFAGLSFTQSATYYKFTDLERVLDVSDVAAAINMGHLVMVNDEDEPKIARAINSLQTLTTGITDDMKFISIVQSMDLIQEDIKNTFKATFVGKYKNNLSNEMLLIVAINSYFRNLQSEDILDNEFGNIATIDTNKMRVVWASKGKDVSALNNEQVARLTIGTEVYLSANIKILNAIESLTFAISMA